MFGFVWVITILEMFSREYTSTLLILVEFLEKGHEICHFWAIPKFNTGTQTRVVAVPLDRTKMVTVPRQSGTSTHLQNRVGTGTDQSGTGTNAPGSPNFWIRALISPKFIHR